LFKPAAARKGRSWARPLQPGFAYDTLHPGQVKRLRKKLSSAVEEATSTGAEAKKNSVTTLNELRPGLKYSVAEKKGPTHSPTFVMTVEVNGETFSGEGK